MVNLAVALLHSYFESVDNLDLTPILSAEKSTEDCIRMRPENSSIKNECAPKGRPVAVWSLRRVRCSEMFKIGRG
jgi:hypothetical protein